MRKILKGFCVGMLLLILWLVFITPFSVFYKYSLDNKEDEDEDGDDDDDYELFDDDYDSKYWSSFNDFYRKRRVDYKANY